jgi:catechol 2,3-dioxygenase-like lactoylglutathione lyase family enzyme
MTTASLQPVANRTPEGATAVIKFHLSLNVRDLQRSLPFYSALLGAQPVKAYTDYAKFEIDEPPLILSLKPKWAGPAGHLNHFGLRLRTVEELAAVEKRLQDAGFRPVRQDGVRCCYAHQTKFWVSDPDGALCEVYVLHDDFAEWGEGSKIALMMAPLRALGFWGSIRRGLSKLFCRSCGTAAAEVPSTQYSNTEQR